MIRMRDIVGGGYDAFWSCRRRYRVVKGSRASKKSKTTALNLIARMMKYPGANLLVVRKVFRTLKDSCFTELKWAIQRLGVQSFWEIKESPLEMRYVPTGQKIYFRGLDDPLKITSITAEAGSLCWMWIEEAYEMGSEVDFDMLDESIRGEVGEGLFKQVTLTLNPWNEHHWIKRRFYDKENGDVLAMTSDYTCNEWLDAADHRIFEEMRERNPRRYRVAGLGEWGIAEGLVYEKWEERDFALEEVRGPGIRAAFGLDFGYTNDPSALFCGLVDEAAKVLWVFDELYGEGMSNERLAEGILQAGYGKERIRADSSEPKSIDRLRELGIGRICAARKGADSVRAGIDYLQDYHMIVHPKCVHFLREIANYTWEADSETGRRLNRPIDDFNHLMDAMRYAMEDFSGGEAFSFV